MMLEMVEQAPDFCWIVGFRAHGFPHSYTLLPLEKCLKYINTTWFYIQISSFSEQRRTEQKSLYNICKSSILGFPNHAKLHDINIKIFSSPLPSSPLPFPPHLSFSLPCPILSSYSFLSPYPSLLWCHHHFLASEVSVQSGFFSPTQPPASAGK